MSKMVCISTFSFPSFYLKLHFLVSERSRQNIWQPSHWSELIDLTGKGRLIGWTERKETKYVCKLFVNPNGLPHMYDIVLLWLPGFSSLSSPFSSSSLLSYALQTYEYTIALSNELYSHFTYRTTCLNNMITMYSCWVSVASVIYMLNILTRVRNLHCPPFAC